MIVTIEEDPVTGESILPLPDEIVGRFNLKEGDTVHLKHLEDGTIEVTFSRDGEQLKA